MKTIEERAKEAGMMSQFRSDYPYDKRSVEFGYMQGATEQKVIDDAEGTNQALMGRGSAINKYKQGYHDAIEMAFKWLKARNVLTDASLRGFRKSMDE